MHWEQANGFSPVCVRTWRVRSEGFLKLFGHKRHLFLKVWSGTKDFELFLMRLSFSSRVSSKSSSDIVLRDIAHSGGKLLVFLGALDGILVWMGATATVGVLIGGSIVGGVNSVKFDSGGTLGSGCNL